jgi:hypothetical protein
LPENGGNLDTEIADATVDLPHRSTDVGVLGVPSLGYRTNDVGRHRPGHAHGRRAISPGACLDLHEQAEATRQYRRNLGSPDQDPLTVTTTIQGLGDAPHAADVGERAADLPNAATVAQRFAVAM